MGKRESWRELLMTPALHKEGEGCSRGELDMSVTNDTRETMERFHVYINRLVDLRKGHGIEVGRLLPCSSPSSEAIQNLQMNGKPYGWKLQRQKVGR